MKLTHDTAINTNSDRRHGVDRRQWNCQHDFPYVDSHGYLVDHNRRQQKDRRHSEDQCATKKHKRSAYGN